MATPNLLIANTVIGNTSTQNVSTISTEIVSNGSETNKIYKINLLLITNTQGSSANVNIILNKNSVETSFLRNIVVPASSSFTAIDKGTSIYLKEGESIKIFASSNNVLDATCSFEEIS
jgi:hypothetical protein